MGLVGSQSGVIWPGEQAVLVSVVPGGCLVNEGKLAGALGFWTM